ncbi:MAG: hypothetical protein IKA50_01825 [Clostridia bacterium]|nr:hypothetical protein [Clostridia bacterium]
MEVERTNNTRGLAGTALGLGAGALGVQLLNGGLGGLFGGWGNGCGNGWGGWNNGCGNGPTVIAACDSDRLINRYELGQEAKISELQSQIALRDANTYNDQKSLELYKYFDSQLKDVRDTLCAQAVHNQKTEDSFVLARQDIAAVESRLNSKIAMEAERRCCADNAIVNYANATFYPKMVADVTVGTTQTAQTLYNPIPDCGCCCGNK